jgi:hypothetical protein
MVNTQLVRQGRAEDKSANVLICNREIIMPPFGPKAALKHYHNLSRL